MATLAVVVAILVVGTALGLVRLIRTNARRIAALEHELADVYQAQQILDRARDRKDRKHLHLLGLVPLAWLFRSSYARLAAASAVSATVIGAGFTAQDNPHQPLHQTPPAAAEAFEGSPAPVDTPVDSYGTPPTPTTTTSTMVAAEASVPPPASAVVEAGSASTAPPPSTVPAPSTTTTTSLVVEVEVPRVCITPAITILDTCAAS